MPCIDIYLHYLGGCYGNGNRFETKDFCENACPYGSRRIMGPGRPKRPGPQGSLVNICNLPRDLGEYLKTYNNLQNIFQMWSLGPNKLQGVNICSLINYTYTNYFFIGIDLDWLEAPERWRILVFKAISMSKIRWICLFLHWKIQN